MTDLWLRRALFLSNEMPLQWGALRNDDGVIIVENYRAEPPPSVSTTT